MLSAGDITPAQELTSSCRRSSVSCDRNGSESATLTRCGSFRGSTSSLVLGVPQWRKESIVELLEKKCRENVSNKLRRQLPQHLHKSSTNPCSDLPIIVRSTATTLSRPCSSQHQGIAQTSTRSNSQAQLYQGVLTEGSSLQQVLCPGRRHFAATEKLDPDRLTRSLSLSRQTRRDADDSKKQAAAAAAAAAAASTIERSSSLHNDRNWAVEKRSTLPAKLHQSFDVQRASDYAESATFTCTSSVQRERMADFDVDPDSSDVDTDSCGELSVNSFTFFPSTSQARDFITSSTAVIGGSDARSKVNVGENINVPSGNAKSQAIEDSINVASTYKILASEPLVHSDMRDTSTKTNGMREIDDKVARPHDIPNLQQNTVHSQAGPDEGKTKTACVKLSVSMSSKDTSVQNTESESQSGVSTQVMSYDRPRYRTSVSLSITSPSVSTTTIKPLCRSSQQRPSGKPGQPSLSESEDGNDLSPAPPLPLSAQPDMVKISRSGSEDEWSEQNEGQITPLQSPIEDTTFRQHNGDMDTEDHRWRSEPNSHDVNIKDDSNHVFTSVTTAEEQFCKLVTACLVQSVSRPCTLTSVNSHRQVSEVVSSSSASEDVNNGHVVTTQHSLRSRPSRNGVVELNETDAVLLRRSTGIADDAACQKNGQKDISSVVGASFPDVLPTDSEQGSKNARQVNGFHGASDLLTITHQSKDTCKSYGNERHLERRGVTSHCMTSSYARTSGSGPPQPVCVIDRPAATGGSDQFTASCLSVDRSWEILRTDSTPAVVTLHKTSLSPRIRATGPQDGTTGSPVVVLPVQDQHAKTAGHRPLLGSPTKPDHTTHVVEQRVGSESGHGNVERLNIVVQKTGLALGFSIEGGKDSLSGNRPITVKKLFREDMKLREGDEILSANGCSLNDLSHFVALNFLKSLPNGKVRLAVRRHTRSNK